MFDHSELREDTGQEPIWTSFVDLLSGLVAILLLSLLMPTLARMAQDKANLEAQKTASATRAKKGLPSYEFHPIQFDQAGRTLTLGEEAFLKDSYHLTPSIAQILDRCQPLIKEYLATARNRIAVEGHSDAMEFRPGSSIRSAVGDIDTNYALSAMRAVAAREYLLASFGRAASGQREFEGRVTVAGYGSDRPRKGTDGPMDPRNRRVEIYFSGDDPASFNKVVQGLGSIVKVF